MEDQKLAAWSAAFMIGTALVVYGVSVGNGFGVILGLGIACIGLVLTQ